MQKHADNMVTIVREFYPKGADILDVTYGTGALWWRFKEDPLLKDHYRIVACDKTPSDRLKFNEIINELDVLTADYRPLVPRGQTGFDIIVIDPPYLVGRDSFDYSAKIVEGALVPMQYQGKRSWNDDRQKYVKNQSIEDFDRRFIALNRVLPDILKPNGHLIIKVMNPRHNGHLIRHTMRIDRILTNLECTDEIPYIRQGATTWSVPGHAQNLHGYYLIYQLKHSEALDKHLESDDDDDEKRNSRGETLEEHLQNELSSIPKIDV